MKTALPAFHILSTGAPFHSVLVRPCTVKAIYEKMGTAEIEIAGDRTKATSYVNFVDLASTAEKATAEVSRRLSLLQPAASETSAVTAMAGRTAG